MHFCGALAHSVPQPLAESCSPAGVTLVQPLSACSLHFAEVSHSQHIVSARRLGLCFSAFDSLKAQTGDGVSVQPSPFLPFTQRRPSDRALV